MALISCPDCGKNISEFADACIGCGRPVKSILHKPEEILPPELAPKKAPPNRESVSVKTLIIPVAALILLITGNWLFTDAERTAMAVLKEKPTLPEVTIKKQPPMPVPPAKPKTGSINGYDPATNSIIDPINLFISYENRGLGISGRTNHGEKLVILDRSGNGIKVKTSAGTMGWISSWFVKEE